MVKYVLVMLNIGFTKKNTEEHKNSGFQRLPPARGGTAQKMIIHLANWSQLIHPGPASSLTKFFFGVESVMRVNADSLLIRAAATSTSGTLNDLTTDLIMANNNNNSESYIMNTSGHYTSSHTHVKLASL